MTKKQAIKILIEMSARFRYGSGTGIYAQKSEKDKEDILLAIEKLWPTVYGHELSDSERYNNHLYKYS